MKTWNHKGHWASFFSSVFFSEAAPQIILKTSYSNISPNSIEKPAVDFCFSCWAYTFISIDLCSMLSLEFWISYFLKYLRLIAVIKSSQRRWSIKKAVLKNFAIFTGKHFCWSPQVNEGVFLWISLKFLEHLLWKCLRMAALCNSTVLSTIIFQLHT